jgi:hypothetical protein
MSRHLVKTGRDSRDELANLTRSILKDVLFENFLPGEGCYLRRQSDDETKIGFIRLNDAINYQYVVRIRNSKTEYRYVSVEALIKDGWRVDQ